MTWILFRLQTNCCSWNAGNNDRPHICSFDLKNSSEMVFFYLFTKTRDFVPIVWVNVEQNIESRKRLHFVKNYYCRFKLHVTALLLPTLNACKYTMLRYGNIRFWIPSLPCDSLVINVITGTLSFETIFVLTRWKLDSPQRNIIPYLFLTVDVFLHNLALLEVHTLCERIERATHDCRLK